MRRVQLMVLLTLGGILVMPSAGIAASNKRVVRQPATTQRNGTMVAVEEQRKATAAAQKATIEEQKVAQRVRWVELQLKREEQLLSQRLAYANRLRAAGLQKNDEKMLKQAEDYERQALAAFQQKVTQYERMLQSTTGGSTPPTPAKTSGSTSRQRPSSSVRMRSTSKPHPQSRLIRRR